MSRTTTSVAAVDNFGMGSTLRSVDLNLLTVFDAVMQEQNITRAAQNLGMSQPAVSNAVARLKVMFNDELFIRHGRGIQPTQRAKQLFGPLRQALQLVKNELPCSIFAPLTSSRTFKLAICSPLDMRFAPTVLSTMREQAPHIQLQLEAEVDADLSQKMRYQVVDFVIDYTLWGEYGFCSMELFSDELVVIAANNHPRISDSISVEEFNNEMHAILKSVSDVKMFADDIYNHSETNCQDAYQGVSLNDIMFVVSQSELIAVAPRWLAEASAENLQIKVLPLPFTNEKITGYLSWHESTQKDKGNIWMRDQLMTICSHLTS
ncbi:transcriptional regulator LeuO [Photobacterium piscicola]|uniref:Transcriptional regulator LeuO n=1 Tax=Photobacterium piscicola TaxID=1378299 RepID=A0ABU6LJF7_9GAMM|nr:transcriptional regulator LeuO [Photobacterium piscicola]MEC6883574.1 transcriptional regulator LeuO [Photobacterium piscicola]MEC6899664.1 transcriptional regulator LeuO [Photobacterium piscicola]